MKRTLLSLLATTWLAAAMPARADTSSGIVVTNCGTPAVTYIAGRAYPITVDTGGSVCFTGSITVPLITNYEQETGGNADLQTAALQALVAAIGSPIPGNLHCQTTATLQASLVCGATGARTLTDFTLTADATLDAAAWYVMIFDATALPSNGAVTPIKCYQVPSGQAQFGGNFTPGGIEVTNGLVLGVSTTGCFTLTTSLHALFIGGSYQ